MNILVINTGSSSIKFGLFNANEHFKLLKKGVAERIGEKKSLIKIFDLNNELKIDVTLPDYKSALYALFDHISKNEIDCVGHRVVHGGDTLKEPTLINPEVMQKIKEASRFAPLHSLPNYVGIEASQEVLPSLPQVAVFDTAAYANLDFKAFLYGIPKEFYEKHKIRKYGFHGINHSYVVTEATKLIGKNNLKIISCHLGSGCSMSAFENGQFKDTSMGLTPLEGLLMGTRCGDIDPSIILYLIDELGLTTKEIIEILNKKSGLLGLCGKNDIRDILSLAESGEKWAMIAVEAFIYRIQKYLGAYVAALNGVDVCIFTGGIGENSSYIREKICANFNYINAVIDQEKNRQNTTCFSKESSKVILLRIPSNEELSIAQQTYHLLNQ